MDSQVTDIPYMLALLANFILKRGVSYFIHGNTPLHEHINYNTQW